MKLTKWKEIYLILLVNAFIKFQRRKPNHVETEYSHFSMTSEAEVHSKKSDFAALVKTYMRIGLIFVCLNHSTN